MDAVVKVSETTWAAAAMADSTSPRRSTDSERTLPPSWTAGAPSAMAAKGSVTGSRTSYSTSMSAAAARAWRRVSAATAASTSPT